MGTHEKSGAELISRDASIIEENQARLSEACMREDQRRSLDCLVYIGKMQGKWSTLALPSAFGGGTSLNSVGGLPETSVFCCSGARIQRFTQTPSCSILACHAPAKCSVSSIIAV